jgi:hypothetical protein
LPDADALALVSLNGGFGEGNLHLIGLEADFGVPKQVVR